ncbi:MAG: MFS transporter [Mesotoga sp.]|uniref:MFS transporter n=1 Tax=Mesotoga sp. TaxID=2053577 RepID=UPI00261643C0|nr:MFS transporter [Mesotoga sp.]MDD5683197.1 MFS transporter [Mesotoga sp.]MDI9367107.1 MFS transporter [Thermotogota bacterium]
MKLRSVFVAASSLVYFMIGFTAQSINSALPAIAVELEMSHDMTGLVLGLPSFVYQIAVLIAAFISRKFGPFLTAATGISCITLSVVFMAISRSYSTFLTGRLLFGFGLGITEISIALCVSYLAFKKTGGVLNLVYSFFALGSIVGPVFVSLVLTDTSKWNIPIFLASALFLMISLLSWIVWKKSSVEPSPAVERRRLTLPKDTVFWMIAVGGLLYVGYEMGLFSWLSTFVYEEKSISLRIASLIPSLLAFGLFVGRIITGFVVDKVGLQRTLVVLGLISSVGFSFSFLAENPIVLALGVFTTGLGFSGTFPTLQAIIVSGYRENREAVLSIFAASGSFGVVITNLLVGRISESTNLRFGMLVIASQILGALAVFFSMNLIHRKRMRRDPR